MLSVIFLTILGIVKAGIDSSSIYLNNSVRFGGRDE
jgi:hypothetical protein